MQHYANSKQQSRLFKTVVAFFYGKPGCGKSRLALELCKSVKDEIPYYKTKGVWWDMYDYEQCVIWDDFRGDCFEPQELFKLCDRYPYKVQIKGGFLNFWSKIIVFTNNVKCPFDLYKDGKSAPFERRIEFCYHLINYDGDNLTYRKLPFHVDYENYMGSFDVIFENKETFFNNVKMFITLNTHDRESSAAT